MSTLDGMTQKRWDLMTPRQRDAVRSDAGLTKQLIGLEGWRVEVESFMTGEKRRFIVGRSSGWIPCHIELSKRTSHGGPSASREYRSVRKLYRVR
jgi:hypothetical protein